MNTLQGRVALVTGSTSGIGFVRAYRLYSHQRSAAHRRRVDGTPGAQLTA